MDKKLEEELARSDQSIPFRYTINHQHQTWANTYRSKPQLYLVPETVEEIRKIVELARICKRRIVMVGSGHSPSEITCTNSWMVSLAKFSRVIRVEGNRMRVQAGTSIRLINDYGASQGLTLPSIGSIHVQSIAGALATGTHGSSIKHGTLSSCVHAIAMMLANGRIVECSASQNRDLFRAALLSLGAVGILIEVELKMHIDRSIKWNQSIMPIGKILTLWDQGMWKSAEYVRVWWSPYSSRAVLWKGDETTDPVQTPAWSVFGGTTFKTWYYAFLVVSHFFPSIIPFFERILFRFQHGFTMYKNVGAVQPQREALLMDCMYSQLANEWAIPMSKGKEAIARLNAWLNHDDNAANIPVSSEGVHIHVPIEVRIVDSSESAETDINSPEEPTYENDGYSDENGNIHTDDQPTRHVTERTRHPRAYLDSTSPTEPTIYIGATIYRVMGMQPPGVIKFFKAFEYLMLQLNGRPHWAKNFAYQTTADFEHMYNKNLDQWRFVRDLADPQGMFVGPWHRRTVLPLGDDPNINDGTTTTATDSVKVGGGGRPDDGSAVARPSLKHLPNEEIGPLGPGATFHRYE